MGNIARRLSADAGRVHGYRSPRLEDLTVEVLEEVRRRGTLYVTRGVGTISHSLRRMGMIARLLSRAIYAAPLAKPLQSDGRRAR